MTDIFKGVNANLKVKAIVGLSYSVVFCGFTCIILAGIGKVHLTDTILVQVINLMFAAVAAVLQNKRNEAIKEN